MRERKVVITGMGAVSPFGWGLELLTQGMAEQRCSLSLLPENEFIEGMFVKVRGVAPDFDVKSIPREFRRTMSHMGVMTFFAACEALRGAGIEPVAPLPVPFRNMGICIASTTVSANTLEYFFSLFLKNRSVDIVRSTVFFKAMGHSLPSTLVAAFGLSGRCMSPAAACASGLQSIGLAYETIKFGKADMMLCGGAEEYHALLSATFDRIGAATHCAEPDTASRPFDMARGGIVCSEGAGVFMLEEDEHARRRGATILAEIAGFGTNTAPSGLVFPDTESIEACMRLALEDAQNAVSVDLVSAHATGTEAGDIAEGRAIERLFGHSVLVNSLKGYFGHCMAASGAIELAAAIDAARAGFAHGTRNLLEPDTRCGNIRLQAEHAEINISSLLKNSFGLGGVNASLLVTI